MFIIADRIDRLPDRVVVYDDTQGVWAELPVNTQVRIWDKIEIKEG